MPHLIIDYTDNLPERPDFPSLFAELHDVLSASGDIDKSHIKSRAVPLADWWVGAEGQAGQVFVHIKLHLLAGRSTEVKRRLVAAMQPVVAAHFSRALAERQCQLCFETIDIDRETYAKVVSPIP
jgi:5-carboxymethyl-2-hydroxymuconate isomerase